MHETKVIPKQIGWFNCGLALGLLIHDWCCGTVP
jgi:hypothetical protein